MILGVDHIALSCSDIDTADVVLRAQGFTRRFASVGLPNGEPKRAFLREWSPHHDIALYGAASGIGVELTRHARALDAKPSAFDVLVTGAVAGASNAGYARPAVAEAFACLIGESPAAVAWPSIGASFWMAPSDAPPSVRAVAYSASALEESKKFWTAGVGGKLQTSAGAAVHIELRSPIPAWSLTVLLVTSGAREERTTPMMDDAGFPVLALLTNRMEADLERIVAAGAVDVSMPFALAPGERPMRVALARGPSGEIVELIEMQRSEKSEQSHGATSR